jgi:hypothetical protein
MPAHTTWLPLLSKSSLFYGVAVLLKTSCSEPEVTSGSSHGTVMEEKPENGAWILAFAEAFASHC